MLDNNKPQEQELSLEDALKQKIAEDNGLPIEKKDDASNEEVKENIEEKVEELSEATLTEEEQLKEEKDELDKEIGNLGLTKRDLLLDGRTPAETMSNLDKFQKEYRSEAEQAAIIYAAKLKAKQESDELEKLKEEKLKASATVYNDIIIEEKAEGIQHESKPAKDVTSIKVKKVDDKNKAFNNILQRKKNKLRTTSVPLANSGYIAHMLGLSSPEIRDISSALQTRDQFAYWDYLYQTIHEKVQQTSIGDMDYDTFLKSTALSELDILLYGMFCSTYPDKNDFPIVCQNAKCKANFDFTYFNTDYLVIDEADKSKAAEAMRALVANQTIDAKQFFLDSNTNNVFRIALENSGYIVEVRHPTLYNQLFDVIKVLVENDVQKASEVTLNRMPYIQRILVPEDENDPETNYIPFEDLMEKIALLTDLDEQDDLALEDGISEHVLSKYTINFMMKDIKCPTCLKAIPDYAVDFRSLLFTIHQIRSVKRK